MKLLIFSDIHGDWKRLEKLMEQESDYYFAAGDLVSWNRGFDECGKILAQRGEKVYVLPGNHETYEAIARMCERYGLNDFHGKSIKIGHYWVAGLGYSSPTPFNTPGEYTEEEIAERLEAFASLKPLVLICHAPPRETPLDEVFAGNHAGSRAVREFIEKYQPKYFFCGHIHEAAGREARLGETIGRNVGKQGYVLEL